MDAPLKPLHWVASSLSDLKACPEAVQDDIGYALQIAQEGSKHKDAKPLQGFTGAGVLEVVEDHDGNTYRAVYTVRFALAVYVLHVFQKKSKKGISTPKPEIDLVKSRLQAAAEHYEQRYGEKAMTNNNSVTEGSGNVFADLGYPNAEEHQTKARLVSQIAKLIERHRMTQAEAAAKLGVDQPKVSAMLKGRFRGFSVYRLMCFVAALGPEVEIVTRDTHSRPAEIEHIGVR